MPYAQSARSADVEAVGVTSVRLTAVPGPPWLAGQTVTLTANVMIDSVPGANRKVQFYIEGPQPRPSVWSMIGEKTTDSQGTAMLTYTIPFTLSYVTVPCRTWSFMAYDTATTTKSNDVDGQIAYPTRITNLNVPSSVDVGKEFTATALLEYQTSPATWSPLAGKNVQVLIDGRKVADVTSSSDGSLSARLTINTAGKHVIMFLFPGEGLALGAATAGAEVPAGLTYTLYLAGLTPLIATAGVVLYNELVKGR